MKKVLIIDDENRTRQLIAEMIESFDMDIETIPEGRNVKSGIKAIKIHNPDIVFLDIKMPDGTGFDILASMPNKTFEVIFITAYEEFAIKAIKFNPLDYLLKPIDITELKAALEKALKTIENRSERAYLDVLQRGVRPLEKRRLALKRQEIIHFA
ncbi:MAG: response regulator [Crocinitomicaceae bacterium]